MTVQKKIGNIYDVTVPRYESLTDIRLWVPGVPKDLTRILHPELKRHVRWRVSGRINRGRPGGRPFWEKVNDAW